AASETLGGPLAVAAELAGGTGAALAEAARSAYVGGMQTAAWAGAAVMLGMGVLALINLRHARVGEQAPPERAPGAARGTPADPPRPPSRPGDRPGVRAGAARGNPAAEERRGTAAVGAAPAAPLARARLRGERACRAPAGPEAPQGR